MNPYAAPALPCVAFLLHFARIMLLESVKKPISKRLKPCYTDYKVYQLTAIDLSVLNLSKL